MTLDYEKSWSDLNARLKALEHESGLVSALQELETYHQQSGFIRDKLRDVQRYTFHHPEHPGRFFRVQYNPRRAQRFAGNGHASSNYTSLNNGCFLCRENILWQQQGTQIGYLIQNDGRSYLALSNPFPLLPAHVVLASTEHRPQEWGFHDAHGLGADLIIDDLVRFADRMPGHLGFYNGVGAGASIPAHLHYQFLRRPEGELEFPLERAALTAQDFGDDPGVVTEYPLEAAVWRGSVDDVISRASRWVLEWAERNKSRLDQLTANIIATRRHGEDGVVLYFVPRDRGKTRPEGFPGLVGGLEVLGEIVMSTPEENVHLCEGTTDYFTLEAILASIHTPLEMA